MKGPLVQNKKYQKRCNNPGLYNEFPGITRGVMKERGIKQLFVMCHPKIRHQIDAQLVRKVG